METEIPALDNTIQLVNNCNSSYRKSFQRVPESGELGWIIISYYVKA